jgi:hypothetical protein
MDLRGNSVKSPTLKPGGMPTIMKAREESKSIFFHAEQVSMKTTAHENVRGDRVRRMSRRNYTVPATDRRQELRIDL